VSLAWTACPAGCGGRAFIGVLALPKRHLAVGCTVCGAVQDVRDPGVFGISAADARRAITGPHDGGGIPARGGLRSLDLGPPGALFSEVA